MAEKREFKGEGRKWGLGAGHDELAFLGRREV